MIDMIQENWVIFTVIGSILLFILPWFWVLKVSLRKKRILDSGISKSARIIRFKPSMFKFGKHAGSEFMQGVDLWLEVNNGGPNSYEVITRSVVHISEFSKIRTDMLVTVKVDPQNQLKTLVVQWYIN